MHHAASCSLKPGCGRAFIQLTAASFNRAAALHTGSIDRLARWEASWEVSNAYVRGVVVE